jgi:hypothetical protein
MDINSYITGFVDGEGCFSVSFNFRSKLTTGIEVRPSFSVAQKKYSLNILQRIQDHFQCGSIRYSKSDGVYKYEVRSISDLVKKIIPHFEKYNLLTAKQNDFLLFSKACSMIHSNLHMNKEKLKDLIELAYAMNQSGSRRNSKQDLLKHLMR